MTSAMTKFMKGHPTMIMRFHTGNEMKVVHHLRRSVRLQRPLELVVPWFESTVGGTSRLLPGLLGGSIPIIET